MYPQMHILRVPEALDGPVLLAWLEQAFGLQVGSVETQSRSFRDTFDWDLYQDGLVVESVDDSRHQHWRVRQLGGGDVHGVLDLPAGVRFGWDLPDTLLGQRLSARLGVRGTLSWGSHRCRVRELQRLDHEGKCLLRMELVEPLKTGRGRRPSLPRWLLVFPYRGYEKALKGVLGRLKKEQGIAPVPEDPMCTVLRAAGREPGPPEPWGAYTLEPSQRSDAALKLILLRLLADMEIQVEGTIAAWDSEFLHEFRVAGRRTRSLMGQVKEVFPAARLERFRKEFSWLGTVTGPCRDLDVYLLAFDDYRAELPSGHQADLDPLRGYLEHHQALERDKIADALRSRRFKTLLTSWRAFLEAPVPARTALANASRPVLEVASERIWKVYRKVIREGQAIKPSSPPDHVHELRKTCKKLRYLLEAFRSLYPAKAMGGLIKELKRLQDNLGTYQDLAVQQASFGRFRAGMAEEGLLDAGVEGALDYLVAELARREGKVRKEFAGRFKAFSGKPNQRRFRKLFRGRK